MKQSGDWKSIINSIALSISKYLVTNAQVLVYEKPTHNISEPRDQWGFRKQTRTVGDDRGKKLNYQFMLISPSVEEIKEFIETWVKKQGKKKEPPTIGIPESYDERIELGMKYMDDFVNKYYVLIQLIPRPKGDYYMGYCPENKDSKSAITHHIKIQNVKRSEIETIVQNWSLDYLPN
jgi:hypothetical protein